MLILTTSQWLLSCVSFCFGLVIFLGVRVIEIEVEIEMEAEVRIGIWHLALVFQEKGVAE